MDKIIIFDGLGNRPVPTMEENSGEVIVETAGYVPTDRLINDMIDAGFRLQMARAQQFDLTGDQEDDGVSYDPTRARGFDLADATRIIQQVSPRLEEQKIAADNAAKEAMQAELDAAAEKRIEAKKAAKAAQAGNELPDDLK